MFEICVLKLQVSSSVDRDVAADVSSTLSEDSGLCRQGQLPRGEHTHAHAHTHTPNAVLSSVSSEDPVTREIYRDFQSLVTRAKQLRKVISPYIHV